MRRSVPLGSTSRVVPVLIAALLLVAAVAPAAAGAATAGDAPEQRQAAAPSPADPATDVLGWEDGYWHNESVSVDQSDGLSDAELRRYVARGMARVEYLRRQEFQSRVPVDVISRERYRNRTAAGSGNRTEFNEWNDQVWEALFIVGESTGSESQISQTTGSSVAGFYSPTNDQITIITPSPDSPTIDNATLIHELTHALQDQHYNLTRARYRGQTQDGELGINGVVEGEANYIEAKYSARCGGAWSCVKDAPSSGGGGGGGGGGPNLGILLTMLNPYSDGPVYVHDIVQRGGWSAFEKRFVNPPASSEQIIHLTDEKPRPISFEDRARNGWKTFPKQGINGSETTGEASMFAMFWYQARTAQADTVNPQVLFETTKQYDTYNYDAAPTDGWANDRLFPYQKGSGEDASYGYVWVTAWDTADDAEEFYDTYLRMLEAHDVRRTDAGYYVVPDGQFADAFLVKLDGKRVTIVNGPSVSAVKNIRPNATPTSTPTTPTPTTATPGSATSGTATDDATTTTGAGFGFLVAVVAVALAGLLARRR
ncbi:Hvo_1808 family surface protein [Halobaculum sp. P14]|uniref:Hvo_1808 family surface protein n=1 Tax=Halobaculum sp. P14 TaxID=3421638 RepID=UPI003EC05A9A